MAGISKKEKIKEYLQSITAKKNKSLLEGCFIGMLFILSVIYKAILRIRLSCYDQGFFPVYKSKLKVISVGNITVGGTGKTPLVAMIAEFLISKKQKVSIISRGYKAMNSEAGFADEPMMLKKQIPEANVIIDKDRKQAIINQEENGSSDIIILDDAFQNCAIDKALDIVCISCLNPFGNKHIIPRGIMRLPFAYLKRADIFVLTHCFKSIDISNTVEVLKKYNHKALICKTKHIPEYFYDFYSNAQESLDFIQDKKIAIVCGISQPKNFSKMLESLNAEIGLKFCYQDHHNFDQDQMKNIIKQCEINNISLIVTTAKDEPRLKMVLNQDEFAELNLRILVLKIKIDLEENEEGFTNSLSSIFTA